ncbi:DUF6497 family protein [Planktotalea sp.]|uniref:DUF6497 family protein n=1 Tax=Planktotalea sp. TaxID=2029877 RepID=UPI0035C7FA53
MKLTCLKIAALVCCFTTPLLAEQTVAVPSGQNVRFFKQLDEPENGIIRLRFIAPDLASPLKRPSFEDLTLDLEALCTEFGLNNLLQNEEQPEQIIVSLSAEPVEFGIANSDVEQVFEAFSVENETCMLEMF